MNVTNDGYYDYEYIAKITATALHCDALSLALLQRNNTKSITKVVVWDVRIIEFLEQQI